MDFVLRRDEPLPEGLHRLAAAQLQRALDQLLAGADPEEEIHEARKALKRLRALVCLARADLGPERMRWEHRALGRCAALLAGQRDAAALVGCLEALQEWSGGAFPRVRRWLAQRQGEAGREGAVGEAVDGLRWAQCRLESWGLQGRGWQSLGPGVRWVYGRARRCLRLARNEGGEEAFHTWRRYVKYGWYHAQVLQGVWPPVMLALQGELDRTAELLGAEHDLTVLAELLAGEETPRVSRAEAQRVAALIPQRQAQLRAAALELGARLYAEPPRALEKRWARYWAAWVGPSASEF